ncbi:MAG: hypothetical protein BWZ09_02124 [Alphaproteobacteria bacterium ADurb.BinA305]|nr:MAG: hypothetical protein BWZ09_02124 [Alphaproteobacteria bacterium ADurb.BinA305]
MRITIFSPCSVGSVETRKSIALLRDNTSFMRPSCGTRFSEMSRREITLMRAAILSLSTSGGWAMSRRMPSVRTRMR